jgi:hypothetical protein
MEDTWASRERPVLDAVVRLLETKPEVLATAIAAETGFEVDVVGRSLLALEGVYITKIAKPWGYHPEAWRVSGVTPDARRAVGQWPTPESLVDRLAEAFGNAADDEPDPERKGRIRQVAGFLSTTGRDVATEVVSKIILRSTGMG